jgi:hypothetical protein
MKTLQRLLFSTALFIAFCPVSNAQALATASASANIVSASGFGKDADLFFSIPWQHIKNQQLVLEAISRSQSRQSVIVTTPGASISTAVFTISGDTNLTFDVSVHNNPLQVTSNGNIVAKEFTCDKFNSSANDKILVELGATLMINPGTQAGRFYSNNLEVSLNYN